jgi:putative Mg2+ transporter-C (MgtC) family protein
MIDPSIFLKLFLAIIISGLIGIERELKERPAGLRTHILVCIGATVLTAVAVDFYGVANLDSASRIIAGVITGIGFLGAGTIINSHHEISGLTTAAGLWVVAGLGIALGMGYYFAAVLSALVIIIILKLRFLEVYIHSKK